MNLVICMAGKNTRFHDVGIDMPKYLLPFTKGETVIEVILKNLMRGNHFDSVTLVAHKRDEFFSKDLLVVLRSLSIDESSLHYIGETRGQADTANLAAVFLSNLETTGPVVYHNADTILLDRDMGQVKKILSEGFGAIDIFQADSKKYSYVTLKKSIIEQIAEKKVISKWATSGLYGFPNLRVFQEFYTKLDDLRVADKKSEIYISDIIALMLNSGIEFKHSSAVNPTDLPTTLVLGSPKEYRDIQELIKLKGYTH